MNTRKIALVSMAALLLTAALPVMASAQGRGMNRNAVPQTNAAAPQISQNVMPGMKGGKNGRGGHGQYGAHGNGQLSELLENNVISQETYDKILQSRSMQKYDELLEKGTITQEEYDAIKTYLASKDTASSAAPSADLKTTLDAMVEKGVITKAQEDAILAEQTPAEALATPEAADSAVAS